MSGAAKSGGDAGEVLVGAIVLAVAAVFLTFAVTRAGAGDAGAAGAALTARFDRVDGVAAGADVRMSGVKVGAVTAVALDPATYRAVVTMNVQAGLKVPDDSVARVASEGLLGGAFISIDPGGSAQMLPQGGEITETQGSIDLLTLFSTAMRGQGGDGAAAEAPAGEP